MFLPREHFWALLSFTFIIFELLESLKEFAYMFLNYLGFHDFASDHLIP